MSTPLFLTQKSFSEGCEILLIDRPSIFHGRQAISWGTKMREGNKEEQGKYFKIFYCNS